MIWHIVSLIIFIISIILIIFRIIIAINRRNKSFINTHNNHEFIYDDLIKRDNKIKTSKKKQTNFIYKSNFKDGEIIQKYIISKIHNEKKLIIEYNEGLENYSFQIFCYDKNIKLIKVINLFYNYLPKYSKNINLPKKCEYINFVENKKGITLDYDQKINYPTILMLLDGVIMATLAFALSFIIGIFLIGNQIDKYLDSFNIFILLSLIVLFVSIYFYAIKFIYRRRTENVIIKEDFEWKNIN